jgi:multidrug transporter EmrE-like cation transporter
VATKAAAIIEVQTQYAVWSGSTVNGTVSHAIGGV